MCKQIQILLQSKEGTYKLWRFYCICLFQILSYVMIMYYKILFYHSKRYNWKEAKVISRLDFILIPNSVTKFEKDFFILENAFSKPSSFFSKWFLLWDVGIQFLIFSSKFRKKFSAHTTKDMAFAPNLILSGIGRSPRPLIHSIQKNIFQF